MLTILLGKEETKSAGIKRKYPANTIKFIEYDSHRFLKYIASAASVLVHTIVDIPCSLLFETTGASEQLQSKKAISILS